MLKWMSKVVFEETLVSGRACLIEIGCKSRCEFWKKHIGNRIREIGKQS